jgi:hypothetical protein
MPQKVLNYAEAAAGNQEFLAKHEVELLKWDDYTDLLLKTKLEIKEKHMITVVSQPFLCGNRKA